MNNEYNPLMNTTVCEDRICATEPRDLRTAVRKEDEVLHQLLDCLGEIYGVLTGEAHPEHKIKGSSNFSEAVWCNVDHACFCRDVARDILREMRG